MFLNPKSQKASVKSEQIDEPETKAQVKPISVKKEHESKAGFQVGVIDDKKVNPIVIENGDFEVEAGWLLVGRTAITGLSATKGRKLEDIFNEIVHFAFLNFDSRVRSNSWISSRAAIAASGIVRFSTKRSGEIDRLPMEWSKSLIPLVNSKKGRVLGRCLAAPLRKEFTEKNLPPPPSKKPVKIKSMKVLRMCALEVLSAAHRLEHYLIQSSHLKNDKNGVGSFSVDFYQDMGFRSNPEFSAFTFRAFEPPVDMSQDDENCEHLDDGSSGDDHSGDRDLCCESASVPGREHSTKCSEVCDEHELIRGGWQVSGPPMDLNDPRLLEIAEPERQFLEAEYQDINASNASGAAFCRSYVLVLMALLLLRHVITEPESVGDGDEDETTFLILFLLRVAGFLLTCYIMAWAISILQRRRQRQFVELDFRAASISHFTTKFEVNLHELALSLLISW
ncbi:hypothetical protein L2E82_49496 [Cichorium intybus]|uniref:Uncharacterized protein n=1 Tax=Cichorium intybus TaxID=13427 RepID=A0ACB8Z103_CICIN|nr:hypothetical protein L2E82_49496 [Cichorium intybus]